MNGEPVTMILTVTHIKSCGHRAQLYMNATRHVSSMNAVPDEEWSVRTFTFHHAQTNSFYCLTIMQYFDLCSHLNFPMGTCFIHTCWRSLIVLFFIKYFLGEMLNSIGCGMDQ